MRHFRYYFDDTLHEINQISLRSGYMVGRKPLIVNFNSLKRRPINNVKGAATRLGRAFVEKLKGMGL